MPSLKQSDRALVAIRSGLFFLAALWIFQAASPSLFAGDDRPPLVRFIEARLKIPLTLRQREAISSAARQAAQEVRDREEACVGRVLDHFGLPHVLSKSILPPEGLPDALTPQQLSEAVSSHLERELTEEESGYIETACRQRTEQVQQVRASYCERLSGITDLPSEELMTMIEMES